MLQNLYQEWKNLRSKDKTRPESDKLKANRDTFQNKRLALLDISPSNVENLLKASRAAYWEEDYDFLINQRKIPQC